MRLRAKIAIYHTLKGFDSRLNLDSAKFDTIGFTRESLDDYMKKVIMVDNPNLWYIVEKFQVTKK